MASGSKKVVIAALVGNGLISITKFVAAALTGSAAMMAEGIHSVVDTGNQALLLLGMGRAKRPPDERFPYGHGKEIYFWSFVVACSLFAVGAGVSIYEGVSHMLHPGELKDPTVSYWVLGIALVFESVAWWVAFKEFGRARGRYGWFEAVRKGKDPTIFVVLFEDSAAMLGLIIAFIGIYTSHALGLPWIDGLTSVIIGLILAGAAIWLAVETHGLLIGEAAEPVVVSGVRSIVLDEPLVLEVREILTLHMGPDTIVVNLAADFSDTGSAAELEEAISRMDERIRADFPRVKRIFIEAEGRTPNGS